MVQRHGCGSRRALCIAVTLALSGTAAAEPRLNIAGAPATIELGSVRFVPGQKLVSAVSLAGNVGCPTSVAPPEGTLQLELDGQRYQIAIPADGSAPISYSPSTAELSFGLVGVTSSECASSGETILDLVTIGANGDPTSRSRIAQNVRAYLPTAQAPRVVLDVTVLDPIRCESFGDNPEDIDGLLVDANGDESMLTGIERVEYRLGASSGRRELRVISRRSASGVQLLQCTSPGLALGSGVPGGSPGIFFASGFEAADSMADVSVSLASDWFKADATDIIGIKADGIDQARLVLTVMNNAGSDAAGVRIREYTPRANAALLSVTGGSPDVTCEPIPADAVANCPEVVDGAGFPLNLNIPQLPAGQGLRLTMHRSLQLPANPVDGASVAVGYAAFVDPDPAAGSSAAPDTALANNTRWVNFAVS